MHIIYMNGGLGNQTFQYIFYRWYRKIMPTVDIVVDDSKFWGDDVPHHGYELQRIFGLELPFLSQRFDSDIWNSMVAKRQQGIDLPEQLRTSGIPITVIREKGVTNIKFNGEIKDFARGESLDIDKNKHLYWHGYWLTNSFYNRAQKEIDEELIFPPFNDPINLKLENKISMASEPTAIHIRRGDMVKLGWAADPEFYKLILKFFDSKNHVSQYLLFSDDIDWCEENADELGLTNIADRLLVVDNNQNDNYWRDLQLMSLCKNRISDRSSFSMLAGLLCKYPHKQDINSWGISI